MSIEKLREQVLAYEAIRTQWTRFIDALAPIVSLEKSASRYNHYEFELLGCLLSVAFQWEIAERDSGHILWAKDGHFKFDHRLDNRGIIYGRENSFAKAKTVPICNLNSDEDSRIKDALADILLELRSTRIG